jgi:hypothetical protein
MKISISAEALKVVNELAAFVESKNTLDAGKRFKRKFLQKIKQTLLTFSDHTICKYPLFAKHKLNCFFIDNWVIAYKKENDAIIVFAVVYGGLLDY